MVALRPQFILRKKGERAQLNQTLFREIHRLIVEQAKRAHALTVRGLDRVAGVKPDVWVIRDERIIGEPRVDLRVTHHERVPASYGHGTQ